MAESRAPTSAESLLMRPESCRHLRPNPSSWSVVAPCGSLEPPAQLAWKVSSPALSATNSAMFRKRLAGIRQATFQIEGYYDTDNPPITVGQDGATLTNLYYYPNVRDFPNRFFTLAYATVDNVTVGSQMPGANYCSISVRGMSQGAFTYPSAAA